MSSRPAQLRLACIELNECANRANSHAVGMLVRSILNHVPPAFGFDTFAEVAANYSGGRSFKSVAERLEGVSRKIADGMMHLPIREREVAPNMTQVDFRSELDLVLAEFCRRLK